MGKKEGDKLHYTGDISVLLQNTGMDTEGLIHMAKKSPLFEVTNDTATKSPSRAAANAAKPLSPSQVSNLRAKKRHVTYSPKEEKGVKDAHYISRWHKCPWYTQQ